MPRCLIITPPFSPFDGGPPAGPAVILSYCKERDITCINLDLNIQFLTKFDVGESNRNNFVGDHAKSKGRVRSARNFFMKSLHLPKIDSNLIPAELESSLSLPYSFDEIQVALDALVNDRFWREFLNDTLFSEILDAPSFIGLSIMGPMQVIPSLLIARLVNEIWPQTKIIAGGAHITLKQVDIEKDKRYGKHIDCFLPGHSELTLVNLLLGEFSLEPGTPGLLFAGQICKPAPLTLPDDCLPPSFELEDLNMYPPDHLSLPIQFARGCAYNNCVFCTYPAVEDYSSPDIEAIAKKFLFAIAGYGTSKFSVKDSLVTAKGLRSISSAVAASSIDWRWSAVTKITPGLKLKSLEELASHGCTTLEFGVETIHSSQQILINKQQSIDLVERVIHDALSSEISVVVNMIYGFPGETESQAEQQLEWFLRLRNRYGDQLIGSHNFLEINQGARMGKRPADYGIVLGPLGPWAFSYPWNAPSWRQNFKKTLIEATSEI